MATVSTSEVWDPSRNKFIKTTTVKVLSSDDWPTPPSNSVDVTRTESDGEKTLTYKEPSDGEPPSPGGPTPTTYNYQIQTTLSSEPLLSFWKFASGQPWALSENDFAQIKLAEDGTETWATIHRWSGDENYVGGLWYYTGLRMRGIDSVLKPSVTLHETFESDTLPSLAEIGKINEAIAANAPTLPSDGNWLFMGMTAEALPNGKWKISNEYRASGPGGWEPTLYGEETA